MYRCAPWLLCSLAVATAHPLAPALQSLTQTASSTAVAADVYVSTPSGVLLYSAAPNGKLTLVAGSPFQTSGLMIGSNGKYFISLGTNYIHAYLIGSSGAIKQQVSQVNTQSYSGAECGTTNGAVLDHTGTYLYVSLNTSRRCDALQTFSIASSNGSLTFRGATSFDYQWPGTDAPPVITANGQFAYNQYLSDTFPHFIINQFTRENAGALVYSGPPAEIDPTNAAGLGYTLSQLTPDPANHLAAVVREADPSDSRTIGGVQQLASYTVGSQGQLTSTNSSTHMPTPRITVDSASMSPSGKLLAIAGEATASGEVPGLQVFHFNGAGVLTVYSGILTSAPIRRIRWDNANHLYAISSGLNKLFVFTVTPTSIVQAPGSPYAISSPSNLFVR
jgi:hypothetical protein